MSNRIRSYSFNSLQTSQSASNLQDSNSIFLKQQTHRTHESSPNEVVVPRSDTDHDNRDRSSTIASIDSLNINRLDSYKSHDYYANSSNRDSPVNEKSPTWLLSDILQSFSNIKDKDEYQIVSKGNDLVALLIQHPYLKNDIILKNFINKIQFMFYHQVSEVKAVGYRILRYIISNYESLSVLIQSKVLIFIIRSMSSNTTLLEKEQALKLVREFLNIPKGTDNLSIGVIKSLISIIEVSEPVANLTDNFRKICIETLCEVALLRPELLFHSGGFNILIQSIIDDDSIELSSNCLLVLIRLLDSRDARKFLRNGYDLNSLISLFSNIDSGEEEISISTFKLQKAAFLLTIFLKNWNGLICFSHNNFECLKDLILNLKKKSPKLRDIIMDVLFDVLRIESLPWLRSSSIGDIIRKYNDLSENNDYSFEYDKLNSERFEFNIINQYLGLFTNILVNNNIILILIEIIEEDSNTSNAKKATSLVTHIYQMATNLLPRELINNKLLLPPLINDNLLLSSTFRIEKLNRKPSYITSNNADNPKLDAKKLKLQIKQINIDSRYNIDDFEFKSMVNNVRILTIKEFEDWNWNLLSNFIQGPLRNPKRFDEILEKNPKILKRLMSFYRPFKFRFCNVPINNKQFKIYINVGCQLLETFLSLNNGIKYLSTNKLLPQLAETFAQIDPFSGITAKEPILSKKRLENTLSIGYLKFISTLSHNIYGLKVLEQWQFVTLFQNIIEGSRNSESNNYLLLNLLSNLDYTIESHMRILLAKALSISNLKIRNFIIDNLIPKLIKIKECEHFITKLLVNEIYDINQEISDKSIKLLYNYYLTNDIHVLNNIINLKPSIDILSKNEHGRILLMNFLNTSRGFKFLEESGIIDIEFHKWETLSGFEYVKHIEQIIQQKFFPYVSKISNGIVPIHFFNYLLRTEEGLMYFQNTKQKNYLDNLIASIESISSRIEDINDDELLVEEEDDDSNTLMYTLKQNLWIIGSIASSKYGIQLLDSMYTGSTEKSIISIILTLFYKSSSWQIRGIALYQLSNISSTIEGIEILDEFNWYSVIDNYDSPLRLCYPKDINEKDIFNIQINNPYRNIKYYTLFSGGDGNLQIDKLFGDIDDEDLIDNDKMHEKILNLIKHLSSVLSKIVRKAMKQLNLIKKNSPAIFENVNLFLKIIKLVDRGNYKFNIRRFIFELFLNTKVLENLVKRDRKSFTSK